MRHKYTMAFVLVVSLAGGALAELPVLARIQKWCLDHGQFDQAKIDKREVRLNGDGSLAEIVSWNVEGVPEPTAEDLSTVSDEELGWLPVSDVYVTNGQVKAKTPAMKEKERQDAKPLSRRKSEDSYRKRCDELLVLVGDPRAGQTPPLALSLDEVGALMSAAYDQNKDKQASKIFSKMLPIVVLLLASDPGWNSDVGWHGGSGD